MTTSKGGIRSRVTPELQAHWLKLWHEGLSLIRIEERGGGFSTHVIGDVIRRHLGVKRLPNRRWC